MNRNLQEDEGMETTWEREGEGTWDRKRGEQPGFRCLVLQSGWQVMPSPILKNNFAARS